MSAWNTIITIALNDAGKKVGVAGLGTIYATLFGPKAAGSSALSKDLSTIIKELKGLQSQLKTIEGDMASVLSDLKTLGFEIDAAAAIPVCAQISSYFESVQNLSKTPLGTQGDVEAFALTVLERAGPMANGENSVFNLLTQLNQFLVDGSATESPIIEKCASTNAGKDFLAYYAVMMGTCVGYQTVLNKGIAVLNWLSAINENRVQITNNALGACIGDQTPPVFAYADVSACIATASTYVANLTAAFDSYVSQDAQTIVQQLGAKGDMAVSVDRPDYGKHGIPITISAYNLSKQYMINTEQALGGAKDQLWLPVKFDAPKSEALTLDLVPSTDLSHVGPNSQTPFVLVANTNLGVSNHTTYLTNEVPEETDLSESILSLFDKYNPDGGTENFTTPPTFLIYLNENGTFNIRFYAYGAAGGEPASTNTLANPDKTDIALKSNPGCDAYNSTAMNLGTFDKAVDRSDPNQWFYLAYASSS